VQGAFVLFDPAADRITVINRARAEKRFQPASTFKMLNSLIAIETRAVKDENEIVPYGGGPQPFPDWEKDMSLRDAMRVSSVPVYQEVARRIGLRRMRHWVQAVGYGNERVGEVVDRFWLHGPLAISTVEQARFAARLARRDLPFAPATMAKVRDILRIEKGADYELFAKTGWARTSKPDTGWWVDWVEHGDRVHSFAINIAMPSKDDIPKRQAIARVLLRELGVLP
jgi:beta-lactamase class D